MNSMWTIGKGRAGLETFTGMMGMLPPVTKCVYSRMNLKIADVMERESRLTAVFLHNTELGTAIKNVSKKEKKITIKIRT